ncbi:MAG TPA: LacI family DNA-binding transcriptional regulator [Acidimicrobiia bacterium]|nr:LacI family DNA-binding transcriptional regulator [Acidimicrobiia bacterium]
MAESRETRTEETPPDRVTIEHVARQAGVSIATVSRVLNGRYGVAPDTIARVQAVIADLGYESSLVARSMRSRRTNLIGIIVADLEPFSAELLKGAARALHDTEYELIVYSGTGRPEHKAGWERRFLSRLHGTLTDGTILVTPTVVDVQGDVPVVAVDPHTGPSDLPTVDSQNLEGAAAATQYLIELGHRRIGFMAGRPDLESARLREEGYRRALAEAGVDFDPELVKVGGYAPESAKEAAEQLLSLDDRPTAIFAANDLSAITTMEVAQEAGISIPADLSVIGFDNIPESALTDPPLTTIDQSIQDMGWEAARLLISLIEGRDEVGDVHVRLPTKLIVRQSCATPPD